MKKARAAETCEASLLPLGFRRTDTEGWTLAQELFTIKAGMTFSPHPVLILSAPGLSLEYAIKNVTGRTFNDRLRRKLGLLLKRALKASRAQKRTKRRGLPPANLTMRRDTEAGPFVSYAQLRSFNPTLFCEKCKRMLRSDMMETEDICLVCSSEKKKK